jgi:2,5-furandicarboxylate decarboxylase 1
MFSRRRGEMAKDLRDYIKLLKEKAPEELMVGEKMVDSKFEAATLLRKLELANKFPMVIFKNVKTIKGEKSSFPLTFNTFASRKKLALALGLEPHQFKMELPLELMKRYGKLIPPQMIGKKDAPVKEVVKKEEEVNLFDYPIPVHHAKDGGPYILGASVATKNPDSGFYNVAMLRLHVKDKNRTVLHAEPHHHSGMIIRSYINEGRPSPFAAVIGYHPSFYLGSQWEGPFGKNEYEIIGGAMQEPLRVTPSETWGEDFLVPADAEMIIEGEVVPNEVDDEGPIGEHTRYYKSIRGGKIEKTTDPVTNITAITHRKDAYFQSCFLAHPDQGLIGAIPKEAAIYEIARRSVPGLKAVHLTPGGVNRYICYLSMDQRVGGEAKDALLAAFIGDWHVKYAAVVDSDVDIFNDLEVLWAIATRTQPHRDIFVIPEAMGSPLDPTIGMTKTRPLTSKMGIDATKPVDEPFSEVCEVPRDLLETMRVEEYLTEFKG